MVDRTKTEGSLELLPLPAIQQRIVVVRERHVMLDEDLAVLYGVQTGRLIQEVQLTRVVRDQRWTNKGTTSGTIAGSTSNTWSSG
jgi:hypothetical protein